MSRMPIHPAISHLDPTEINDLVAGYLAGTSAVALLEHFKIAVSPSQIRKILPPMVLDQICTLCGSNLIQELPLRRQKNIEVGRVRCPACGHEERDECQCQQCVTERRRKLTDERSRIQAEIFQATLAKRLHISVTDHTIDSLPLRDAVAFLAFTRCCPINRKGLCGPFDENPTPYAPTESFMHSLLESLSQIGLIGVSECSAPGTIALDGDELIFDIQKILWIVQIDDAKDLIQQIELCGLNGSWPEGWIDQVEDLWTELALSECRQFYDYCAIKRGLRAQGDVAVNIMLTNILRDFSVAQCYNIIWQGARNASDFLVRERPNRAHAANYMVGACQRWADRARAENWAVNSFKRNFDLPRSMVSYVLMDVLLKIGECGFTNVVCRANISSA